LLLLAAALGLPSGSNAETVQATYAKAGSQVSVTLTIYGYSTSSDLQFLSQAFQDGQDKGLATALSRTKSVGYCSITGALSYQVSFIQMVLTPTGRRITFITNRPLQLGEVEVNADSTSQSYDLAIGQFDINDADASKSSGFLYPASKLVIDKLGELHYDLAGIPWSLVNVLDSKAASSEALAQFPAK
jgi:hypothetical protein